MRAVRYLAPSGAPIRSVDLARWAWTLVGRGQSAEAFRDEIRTRFDVEHVLLTSTGRAGLTLLLRALRRLSSPTRDEVVLPSYTCYSVAGSIEKAGLRPRLVDVSPETLDYAPEALASADYSRTLAIIVTNLYGLPSRVDLVRRIAADRGAFLIDDAAQAMGATAGDQWCGARADAGLFSLDKGKNVSAIDGGVVVTSRRDIWEALRAETVSLPRPGVLEAGVACVKAIGYYAMLRPWLYAIPASIPQLGLGQTVYSTDYPLEQPSRPLTALARTMIHRLDAFTEARRANAQRYLDRLAGVAAVRPVSPLESSVPVYLRLPVMMADEEARRRALAELPAIGIGATGSYPASLADVPELREKLAEPDAPMPGGRYVSRHLLTLPTHTFVTAADIDRAVTCLCATAGAAPDAREVAAMTDRAPVRRVR